MNEKYKTIIDEIEEIIKELANDGGDIPKEVLDLVDDLVNKISKLNKEDKNRKELNAKFDELVTAVDKNSLLSNANVFRITSALKKIDIEPKVNVSPPIVNVSVPEIKVPEINYSPPDIHVSVPDIKMPEVKIPQINTPKEMDIKKPKWLSSIVTLKPIVDLLRELVTMVSKFSLPKKATEPIPVRLSDGEEFYRARGGSSGGGGGSVGVSFIDLLARYRIADKDDDAEPNYFGFTTNKGGWYILKEENSSYRYTSGESNYSDSWTDRTSLTYDYLFNISLYD